MTDINNLSEDNIKDMIALLSSMLEAKNQTKPDNSRAKKQNSHIATSSTKNKNRRNIKKQNQETQQRNLFDDMQEKAMHKEDTRIDELLSCAPPGPRTRKFSLIDVCCRVCGKKETISPSLLHDSIDRYKCNKCCGGPG